MLTEGEMLCIIILVVFMNMIVNTIKKEKNRIEYMLSKYIEMEESLPKGSIHSVNKNANTYYYLKYRSGKKVVSEYLGKDIAETEKLIEKRKHAEIMIKFLEKELKIANKALEGQI